MAVQKIDIEEFLELSKLHPVFDVRSPGEYDHAHIPGANSLPLFTDQERKVVGTAYKQQSREQAIKLGLDFFGPKMRPMVESVESKSEIQNKKYESAASTNPVPPTSKIVLVYCWRGGMRSGAVSWLLDIYGFKVYTLIGGYKKFRNYVLDTFRLPFQFNILGGYTGSGKTELLKVLQERGEKVIDLESIAKHKGSAFGNIGMPKQPGQEMFENLLSCELRAVSSEQNTESPKAPFRRFGGSIWLEDESQRIGQVNIPHDLWKTMRQSPVFFLDIPFEDRLKHIVQEYGQLDKEKVAEAIGRITQKLGHLNAKTAISLLYEGKTSESFDILLKYYDKHYFKSLHNREGINSLLQTVDCKSVIPENAALLLDKVHISSEKV
ncbi:MAG: tRNA 2-selenouridine(34) synthase MnmH [Chitinophagaceae bacterium]|nr:tRNA 2-selenouridine(34) synthase MnmH [Chitinophagaceae bacterium]